MKEEIRKSLENMIYFIACETEYDDLEESLKNGEDFRGHIISDVAIVEKELLGTEDVMFVAREIMRQTGTS